MKPERFILTTDYATLKNDASAILSVTVPSSVTVAGNGVYSISSSASIGQIGASERSQIVSSKIGEVYSANIVVIYRWGTESGLPAIYDINVDLSRTDANTLTLSATIMNPYSTTLQCESGSETFTAYVATFLPPFNV